MLVDELQMAWQESMQDADFRFALKLQAMSVQLCSAFSNSGLSRKQLAEKLGWSVDSLNRVLRADTNLTFQEVFDLCTALSSDFDFSVKPDLG